VNPDKSSAILFTRRRLHRPVGEIVMFDQPIPWKNEVRYLGISFDNYLRFNAKLEHAKTRGQMVRGQLNSLVNQVHQEQNHHLPNNDPTDHDVRLCDLGERVLHATPEAAVRAE
jgi:hypothetical protein